MNYTSFTRQEKTTIIILAMITFLLHFVTNLRGGYGFFRDELYYIACSDHLAWGYVDQPPVSIWILKLSRMLLGDSLAAMRFIPALLHAGTVLLAACIVKEMGGKIYSIFLVGMAVFISIIHQAMGSFYSMNAIDIFIWAWAVYVLVKIKKTRSTHYWIWLGIILGIGLMNKISVLFLGAGIFTGLLFTDRSWFLTKWPYVAGVIALLLFLPYVVWNFNNDMAHLEFIHNASAGKYAHRTAIDFIKEQLLLLNPVNIPLFLCGLAVLFFYKPLHDFKILGYLFSTAFLILAFNKTSKGEYMAPGYVSLFAAGSIFIEQKLITRYTAWLRVVYPVFMFSSLLLLLPLVMPVLPVERYIAYSRSLGIMPHSTEKKELAELPQFYADMFGWKEKAHDVAQVYNTLSKEDQRKCAILSTNYGRCGAIDFFGTAYGLPKSIGIHNNYWLWGTRDYTGEVMIILGGSMADHKDDFETCKEVAVSTCQYCMPYENNVSIFLCRGLKNNLKEVWKDEKQYE